MNCVANKKKYDEKRKQKIFLPVNQEQQKQQKKNYWPWMNRIESCSMRHELDKLLDPDPELFGENKSFFLFSNQNWMNE